MSRSIFFACSMRALFSSSRASCKARQAHLKVLNCLRRSLTLHNAFHNKRCKVALSIEISIVCYATSKQQDDHELQQSLHDWFKNVSKNTAAMKDVSAVL